MIRVIDAYITVEGLTYCLVITPDWEGGGYQVKCPQFKGCETRGDVLEVAIENGAEAVMLKLEEHAKHKPGEAA